MSEDVEHYITLLKRTVATLEDAMKHDGSHPPPRCMLCGGVLVQERNKYGGAMPWLHCTSCDEHFMLVQERGHEVRE